MRKIINIALSFIFISYGSLVFSEQKIFDRALSNIQLDYASNNSLVIEKRLIFLAERGGHKSQQFLAHRYTAQRNKLSNKKAISWYKKAFANGRGEITALSSLVKLNTSANRNRDTLEPWVTKAIKKYDHYKNLANVETTLEVFYHYPNLFSKKEFFKLNTIHKRSCIDDCLFNLYLSRYEEYYGDKNKALPLYKHAFQQSPRAIERYYFLLGENRKKIFRENSPILETEIQQLPDKSISKIGNLLIASSEVVDNKTQFNKDVNVWLDNAIKQNNESAYKAKIQYTLEYPEFYNIKEFNKLIDEYSKISPLWADYYKALGYLTLEWRNIKPQAAKEILTSLLKKNFWSAYLGLAKMKSMGVEGETDQLASIVMYEKAAKKGIIQADYKMATLYSNSKGMCRDYTKAYAHNEIALDNGVLSAFRSKELLDTKLTPEEKVISLKHKEEILKARL